MRILVHAKFPHEKFNSAVRDGSAGEKIKRILDELNPEAVYFTEYDGRRGAIMIVDIKSPSDIPAIAEPWFLCFDADCSFHPAMTPEDLSTAGLENLGKKWA